MAKTKSVQWAKILGLKGVKIYKDKNKFGFSLTIKMSCNRRRLTALTKKLKVAGFNAKAVGCQVSDCFGYALIDITTNDLDVARAKLTDAQYELIKADILANVKP